MQQLGGIDSFWLNLEGYTMPMHVAGLWVLDPTTAAHGFDMATVRRLFEDRLHLVPLMRRRLVEVPGNLDHPYWIEDPNFDIEYHLRHRALPAPGDRAQLVDLVTHIFSRPLDRSRPLWEFYLIEGLADGRVAALTKVHHAAIDGVSGAEIMVNLLDLTPETRVVAPPKQPWTPDPVPSGRQLLTMSGKAYLKRPSRAWEALPHTLGALSVAAKRALNQETEKMVSMPFNAPRSRFNKRIGPHRSFGMAQAPLQLAKDAKNGLGCTVNDVVLTAVGGALRSYLKTKADLPEKPLLAAVPISVRGTADASDMGNRLSFMFCQLGTDVADPIKRIAAIKTSTDQGKAGQKVVGADLLQDWTHFAAPAVLARAGRALAELSASVRFRPMFNLAVSNVPGPQFPLYFAGAKVAEMYPLSLCFDGAGFNITVMSYDGRLAFGLTADRTTVPDIQKVADAIVAELETLAALGRKKAKPAAKRTAARKPAATQKAAAKKPAVKKPAAKTPSVPGKGRPKAPANA